MNTDNLNNLIVETIAFLEDPAVRDELFLALNTLNVVSQIEQKLSHSLLDRRIHSAEMGTVRRFIAFATFPAPLSSALNTITSNDGDFENFVRGRRSKSIQSLMPSTSPSLYATILVCSTDGEEFEVALGVLVDGGKSFDFARTP